MFYAATCIAEGKLPKSACKLLSSARLIALPKASGDVRPIAIGEVLRQVTAKAICCQLKKSLSAFFAPIQHGVATDNGSELVVNHIRLLLEFNKDWTILKTDVKNAFNSIRRSHLLQKVYESFPQIYNHVSQMYSDISSLVYTNGKRVSILSSEEGIHQGDPLGPALFSIAIQSSLLEVQRANPNVTCLAYLDDVFILGPVDAVVAASADLRSSFSPIGLVIQDKKCELFISEVSPPCDVSFPVSSDGVIILGIPIGNSSFISTVCTDCAQSGSLLCEELLQLEDTQSALLLLRYCHINRLCHLLRSIPPQDLSHAAVIHDRQTRTAFTKLLNIDEMTAEPWAQATLPVRYGGFGMTPATHLSPIAFASGWAHSFHVLLDRFPTLQPLVTSVINETTSSIAQENSISHHLQQSLCPGQALSDLLCNTKGLQHNLTEKQTKLKVQDMIERSATKDAARLRSLQGRGSGAWLDVIPSSRKLAISPGLFRLAALLRLGMRLPLPLSATLCDCGTALDPEGYHLITCKTGGGPVWSHNSIVSAWSECLKRVSLPHTVEPRDCYSSSQSRPDIAVYNATDFNVELDISLAHPWSTDIISVAATTDGSAASKREGKKREKYSRETHTSGGSPCLIPLVFEHYGRWGNAGEKFLHQISLRSRDDDGKVNSSEFKTYWRRLMSITLQRCNSMVLAKKIDRIVCRNDSVAGFYSYQSVR